MPAAACRRCVSDPRMWRKDLLSALEDGQELWKLGRRRSIAACYALRAWSGCSGVQRSVVVLFTVRLRLIPTGALRHMHYGAHRRARLPIERTGRVRLSSRDKTGCRSAVAIIACRYMPTERRYLAEHGLVVALCASAVLPANAGWIACLVEWALLRRLCCMVTIARVVVPDYCCPWARCGARYSPPSSPEAGAIDGRETRKACERTSSDASADGPRANHR